MRRIACFADVITYAITVSSKFSLLVVAVAQLVEHRIVIPSVASSSLVGHPNFFLLFNKIDFSNSSESRDDQKLAPRSI